VHHSLQNHTPRYLNEDRGFPMHVIHILNALLFGLPYL
jgi:hypothetical protein